MPENTEAAHTISYEEFVDEVGEERAEESFRLAQLNAEGKINNWETLDIGVDHSRNGQSHTYIIDEPTVETPTQPPSSRTPTS